MAPLRTLEAERASTRWDLLKVSEIESSSGSNLLLSAANDAARRRDLSAGLRRLNGAGKSANS